MDRYRQPTSPPADDGALQEGDSSLIGVNSFDSAENLQPGQCQSATNMDFTTQDAATRGGFVCIPSLGSSPFGFQWTEQTTIARDSWQSVTYGNGLFVAVSGIGGTADQVMISSDGVTWMGQVSAEDNQWTSVTFGSGLFVAVALTGTHRVMTSPDGVTWTARTASAASDWRSVTYGAGLYIAVGTGASGASNAVMTSPDGITWTSRTAAANKQWNAVTYGSGLFVAVAGVSGAGNEVMTSPDGITWTSRAEAESNGWTAVTYGNGLYVAVTQTGTHRVMTSPDGITWTVRNAALALNWNSLAYGNGLFVAVATGGFIGASMTSYNGIIWSTQPTSVTESWSGLAFGGGKFVAVASTGSPNTFAMTSNSLQNVWGSGIYSDPSDPGSQWIMLVGSSEVGFFAFGRTSRAVLYSSGLTVSEPSTIVQADNQVYIFRGSSAVPLYWDGTWGGTFTLAPTPAPGPGFEVIPNSNQATFYQNRLWVIASKDDVAASDVLDFTTFDQLANDFNLNTGDSNYLVTTYPFGTTTLVVFKNKSIIALTSVDGALTDVVATEITRQVGIIGINAVVSVGSDLVYMSDRNINLLSLTDTSNALQHQTLPLSRNIRSIFARVNWQVADKVSMAYWDNKLYVSLPLDNATSCNTVVVYNFITQQWFGEWTFAASIAMAIQGWAVATYLGTTRLHCVTEDGRIFVTNEGQNDISGTIVADIATSLTTRAYAMDNENRFSRRLFMDLATNRPDYSVTAYVEGAGESTQELTDQTYSRADSWIFSDTPYDLTNANDDYNRAFRRDYSTGPASVQCGTGFQPEMLQEFRLPIISRRNGRLQWMKVTNATGRFRVNGVGFEARPGYRSSLIQVG